MEPNLNPNVENPTSQDVEAVTVQEATEQAQPVEEQAPKSKKGIPSGVKRLLTGIVLAGVMFFFLLYLRPICVHSFDIIGMFFVVMGGIEMRKALLAGGKKVLLIPQIVFFVILYPLFWFFNTEGIMLALAAASCVGMVMFTFNTKVTLSDLGYTVFEMLYPSVFVAMIMAVNRYAGDLLAILLLLAVPLVSDIFAYFVGSLFGKHKLCPAISPKKTVEGLIGGIVGAMLSACAIMLLFDVFHLFDDVNNIAIKAISDKLWVSILVYSLLGVLIMLAGMVGDLVASRIKRSVGIKDYGKIFPGHGGVMDRMDSVIFAMPVVYLFFTIYNAIPKASSVVTAVGALFDLL